MLARERWELADIEEQRRVQEKERAKIEFRYGAHASSRLRNDLLCVEWDVTLHTHSATLVLLLLDKQLFLQWCNDL